MEGRGHRDSDSKKCTCTTADASKQESFHVGTQKATGQTGMPAYKYKNSGLDGCTFTAANVQGAESSYGNTANQAIRYIHIQPSASDNVVADITITNNTFQNCSNVVDSVVGIFYIASGTTLTVGGNSCSDYKPAQEDGTAGMFCFGWPPMLTVDYLSVWTGAQQTFTY